MRVVSEGPVKITKATVEAAWKRRAQKQRLVIRDAECRGLALVVNPTGMSWVFSYKPRGLDPETGKRWPSASVTIGTPESHSPDSARDGAGKAKGAVKSGGDPSAERKAAAQARTAKQVRTVGRMLDLYERALPMRPRMRGDGGLLSARHIGYEIAHAKAAARTMRIEALPVADVAPSHLRLLLTAEAARPATARHRLGAFSRFCDWLQDDGHIAANPCALLGRRQRRIVVARRTDYLDPSGLARLWHAASALGTVHRDLVRFLIAVPCRRGEAARMDWSHLDLSGAVWAIPAAHSKNRDAHRLHLHPLALAILRARWEAAEKPRAGLVFPAPESGKVIDTFSDMKLRLVAAVQKADADALERTGESVPSLPAWRWHDFRRSFATALGEAGIPEAVADAILNHRQAATRGGVLGVYQRAQRRPEQVAAMKRWGVMLEAAIAGTEEAGANIVEFPAAAGHAQG
jgi:integrase